MMLAGIESIAVVLAIAYLLLAARESLWCWYCAFVSSVIYTWIFWDVSLLMESVLNLFYVVMAVVGWWQWRQPAATTTGLSQPEKKLQISSMTLRQHLLLWGVLLALALVNGWLMQRYTSAVWPYLDAFTTWASVINTFLVVRKVLENWLYWILIDSISIFLYIDRGLYQTALLFAVYVVIVVFGYLSWRRIYQQQKM